MRFNVRSIIYTRLSIARIYRIAQRAGGDVLARATYEPVSNYKYIQVEVSFKAKSRIFNDENASIHFNDNFHYDIHVEAIGFSLRRQFITTLIY